MERLVDGKWQPYLANDVQMEFVRIDPFVRLTMTPSSTGMFSVKFKVMVPTRDEGAKEQSVQGFEVLYHECAGTEDEDENIWK